MYVPTANHLTHHRLGYYIRFPYPPAPISCGCGFRHWSFFDLFIVNLTIVDQFSKADHFFPLPKLPSALEPIKSPGSTSLSGAGDSFRRCVRSGSPILLPGLEGVLSIPGSISQLLVKVPSPIQWPDWAG